MGIVTPIRVLLAEDHALVRSGIRALLEGLAGIQVVAEAGDGYETLELAATRHPDVVLMDISMPGLNGLEVTARLTKAHPGTPVLVLSMHREVEYVSQALRMGAAGYLLKDGSGPELEIAVRAVARGDRYLSPAISQPVIDEYVNHPGKAGPLELLTARQREVLQLIAEGYSSKQVAQKLRLGIKTVETHRAQLMKRLGVHSIAGLVRYAVHAGMISPER